MAIFILRDNQQEGPYQEIQVRDALAQGSLTPETMAWMEGAATWRPLGELFPETAPPAPVVVREVALPKMPFTSILVDAAQYPFCKSGWLMIVVGAIFFMVIRLFTGMIGGLFISGYLVAFYIDIIAISASGSDNPPDWPSFTSFFDDILRPYFQGLCASAIALLPALVLVVLAIQYQSIPLIAAAGAGVVWSVFYYPMAMIGVVVFGNVGGAMPHRVIPALLRTFPSSLMLGIMNLILLAAPMCNSSLAHQIPVVGPVYKYAIYLYCLMVEARFLGLFYQRERAALRWD